MKKVKEISLLVGSSHDRNLRIHQVNLLHLELFSSLNYEVPCCTSAYTNLLCYIKLKYLRSFYIFFLQL